MNYSFETISKKELHRIEALWKKLNSIHLHESPYFKDHFRSYSFQERCSKFEQYPHDCLKIDIILKHKQIRGYCISTITGKTGEIDSLFIEESERSGGQGKALVARSLNWFEERGCKKVQVAVSFGHEDVFGFYQSLGFYPRMTYLELKD